MSEYQWNITKCRAKYENHRDANYTFWIVDYFIEKDILFAKYDRDLGFLNKHITDFRNDGVVKTKYFMKEEEAIEFILGLNKKETIDKI